MERAAAGLVKVMAEVLRRVPASEAPLMIWPMVCGQAVARCTRAVSFSGGVLCVEVSDAAWRAQLSGLAGKYLAAINSVVPEAVREIRFEVREGQ
jgi:predicted nucleic acid-binding Zn ribbon protein